MTPSARQKAKETRLLTHGPYAKAAFESKESADFDTDFSAVL